MGRKALPPAGLGPLGGKLFFKWANFLEVKKIPYLKLGPFGNHIFLIPRGMKKAYFPFPQGIEIVIPHFPHSSWGFGNSILIISFQAFINSWRENHERQKVLPLVGGNGILLPKFYWLTVRKILLKNRGWRPRICKNFEITWTIYSNSEIWFKKVLLLIYVIHEWPRNPSFVYMCR